METVENIKTIVADTFNLDYVDVNDDTGPENIESWDSFGLMALVLAIEKEFSFVLEYDEIFQILSVETLIEVVKEKLNGS